MGTASRIRSGPRQSPADGSTPNPPLRPPIQSVRVASFSVALWPRFRLAPTSTRSVLSKCGSVRYRVGQDTKDVERADRSLLMEGQAWNYKARPEPVEFPLSHTARRSKHRVHVVQRVHVVNRVGDLAHDRIGRGLDRASAKTTCPQTTAAANHGEPAGLKDTRSQSAWPSRQMGFGTNALRAGPSRDLSGWEISPGR